MERNCNPVLAEERKANTPDPSACWLVNTRRTLNPQITADILRKTARPKSLRRT